MLEKYLTKEEKKLYSEKRWKQVAKNDYVAYIDFHQNRLNSLKEHYKSDNTINHKMDEEIKRLHEFVERINQYYYEYLIPNPKHKQNIYFEIEGEIEKTLEDLSKTFDQLQ